MEEVLLVDMRDRPTGSMEKQAAHEQGKLHRAFSVFLFSRNMLLMQKRAETKYHCAGLWTNTCCSHPRPGESIQEAAKRRLIEELGINIKELEEVGSFVYRTPFANGLTEFEFDHVLIGEYRGRCIENHDEVEIVQWIDINELASNMLNQPEQYTPWFFTAEKIAIEAWREHGYRML